MNLVHEIEKAKRSYHAAKPHSARRTEKHRKHVDLMCQLLRRKPRKAKRA